MVLPSKLQNARLKILLLKDKYSKDTIPSQSRHSEFRSSPLSSNESLIGIYRKPTQEIHHTTLHSSNETESIETSSDNDEHRSTKEFKLVKNNSSSQLIQTNQRSTNLTVTESISKQSSDDEEVSELSESLKDSEIHHQLNRLCFFSSSSDEVSIKEEVGFALHEIPSSSIDEKVSTFSESVSPHFIDGCVGTNSEVVLYREDVDKIDDSISIKRSLSSELSLNLGITRTGEKETSNLIIKQPNSNHNWVTKFGPSKQTLTNNFATEFISATESENDSRKKEEQGSRSEQFIKESDGSSFHTKLSTVDKILTKNTGTLKSQDSVVYTSKDIITSDSMKFVGEISLSQLKPKIKLTNSNPNSSCTESDEINYLEIKTSPGTIGGMKEVLVNKSKLSKTTNVNRKHHANNKLTRNSICVKPSKRRPILKSCTLLKHDETNNDDFNTQDHKAAPYRPKTNESIKYCNINRTDVSCDEVVKQLLKDQIQLTRHFIESHHQMYLLCCQAVKSLNEK